MSQKWFIAFLGVMDYFNFSFSAFKSSRLSPCSPAVLSAQRFKESIRVDTEHIITIGYGNNTVKATTDEIVVTTF